MSPRSLRVIKPEIRVLGVDDGKFVPHSKSLVPVVGVVFRGGSWLEGVMSTLVAVDGLDANRKIVDMITGSPYYKQLRVVMLNGITLGGFNMVDIKALNAQTNLPVIVVTNRKPNLTQVHAALQNLPNSQTRWTAVLNAGEIFPVATRSGKQPVYVEIAGISKEKAEEILRLTSTRSKIPEPLRVAHLVASGISLNST
ncbi:MAG: DUF99 family protein [Candidatus Bathyarchaeota archaeon]|nr:DUF99 family protein [Candidatus Bathyarchaeota archaeon]